MRKLNLIYACFLFQNTSRTHARCTPLSTLAKTIIHLPARARIPGHAPRSIPYIKSLFEYCVALKKKMYRNITEKKKKTIKTVNVCFLYEL